MFKYLFIVLFLAFSFNCIAQMPDEARPIPDQLEKLANVIQPQLIKRHLQIISSDAFEGRETGSPGNKKAAEYIAGQFEKFGLKPVGKQTDYFQKIEFRWTKWNNISLDINGIEYKHLRDFIAFPDRNSQELPQINSDEIIFLGYGIDNGEYDDYKNYYVKDQVLLVYGGEPINKDGISQITGSEDKSEWSTDPLKKAQLARKRGAKLLLIIDDNFAENLRKNRRRMLGPRLVMQEPGVYPQQTCPHVYISTEMAKSILGKKIKKVIKAREKMQEKGKSKKVGVKTDISGSMERSVKIVESSNVIGMVEGNDPEKKNEYLIVTAHYDHLGKRGEEIYNGADDNGSGTSTVLSIMQATAMGKSYGMGPERSVVFLLVTGEEKGLLGSKYYSEHPILPLENAVANVNIDMIGRVDKKHAENPNYIYVIGADRLSSELHVINEEMNDRYTNLDLDYTYNDEDDPNRYYYRSDHYNFAKHGIPAIFFFSGTHEDYHQPSDTIDKIMFDKTAKIGQHIFYLIWELANREKRIEVDVIEEP